MFEFIDAEAPNVQGCNSATNQYSVDTSTKLDSGQSSKVVSWTTPTAAGTSSVRTHNGRMSGNQFEAGLTEIIYIFGTPGAEATCTWRVYVLGKPDTE